MTVNRDEECRALLRAFNKRATRLLKRREVGTQNLHEIGIKARECISEIRKIAPEYSPHDIFCQRIKQTPHECWEEPTLWQ